MEMNEMNILVNQLLNFVLFGWLLFVFLQTNSISVVYFLFFHDIVNYVYDSKLF